MIRQIKTACSRMVLGAVALLFLVYGVGITAAHAADKQHYKIYLNMSYSGNTWQTEAANGIKAIAATPPYDKMVDLKLVISGTDVQHQISDMQSMIASGADAILMYPLTPSGLNRVIEQACKRGILVFSYDTTTTAPCMYNVSDITSHYGANSAQWIVNTLGGKGEVVINHGVAGTSLTNTFDKQALHVFKKYPGIKIVSQFYGDWNDAKSHQETAKVLASHPNIDAIWAVDGSYGSLQAVMEHRPERLVTITGQSNNGFRLLGIDPELRKKGLNILNSHEGPVIGPYTFKLMMEVLTGKTKLKSHNIEYPTPWVTADNIKVCEGDKFVDGCNTFPEGKVSPLFIDTSLDPATVPELDLHAINTGKPVAGATIQPLPPVRYGEDLPGVNCAQCELSPDWLEPNRIKPIPVPK